MLPNTHSVFYGDDLEIRGQYLDFLDKVDLKINPDVTFKPGHRYVVIYNDDAKDASEQPHQIIQSKGIHFGPRNENFYDYTKCPYLTTIDGIYFKFIYKRYERAGDWLDEETYLNLEKNWERIKNSIRGAELMSGISKRTGEKWFRFVRDRLKDAGDDVRKFCEDPNFIKTPKEIKYTERIRTVDRIRSSFDYFLNKDPETVFGFDYETSGFPMEDPDFEVMGLGIACCDDDAVGCYYDVQWMREVGTGGEYDVFIENLKRYLDKFENSTTYNNGFEQKVTYLLTGKLCLFDEAATINKCDGLVSKRFSLKYTVQRVLGNRSWDDYFDKLNDDLLPWLFESSRDSWKDSEAWTKIKELFPDDVDEFELLINRHWGDPFSCIPSNIQTQYCCRDAYYTGLLKQDCMSRYSKLCWDTYNHNLQLESLLHLTGFFLDEDLRLKMHLQCSWLEVYGKLNVVRWALSETLRYYKNINLPEVPIISILIREGYDPTSSKPLIMNHLSDTSESGVDEDWFKSIFGEKISNDIFDMIKEYCFRIDESFSRSRKVFNAVDEYLEETFKPYYSPSYCKFTVDGQEYRLDLNIDLVREYYETKSNYEVTVNFCNQLSFKDIEKLTLPHLGQFNLPKGLKDLDGELMHLSDVLDLLDTFFNYKSSKVSPYLKFMTFNRFKGILYHAYATDYESIPLDQTVELTDELIQACREKEFNADKLEYLAKEYINEDLENLKLTNTWKKYEMSGDFMSLFYGALMDLQWMVDSHNKPLLIRSENGEVIENPDVEGNLRDVSLFQHTKTGDKDESGNPIYDWSPEVKAWYDLLKTELGGGWFDFMPRYMGYWSLSEEDSLKFADTIDDIDIEGDTVGALAKLNYCFMSARKYNKVRTAYLEGEAFYSHNESVSYFNEDGITPNRYEDKGIHKCYLPFYANQKKSKRWASGYHTIPSKSEMKKLIITPPGYLMSYFDISGAEIRTISFQSEDDFMMDCYKQGKDPYITMASYTFPRDKEPYSEMSDEEYGDYLKDWRGAFKQVLLGSLYGMGPDKMADLAEISVEEAQQVMDDLWKRCPKLKAFIEKKSTWAEEHPGFVQSALGDVMELGDDDGDDRLARLGINQFIQNYSSVSLADGFMNNLEKSIHHNDEKLKDKDFILRPLGVVHDSCQIYFPTKYLFEMSDYYTRNLSGYLYDLHKILYAFDLEIGTNYYDMLDLKQLDDTHIELKGSYTAISDFINKLRSDGLQFKINSLKTAPKHGDPEDIEVNEFTFGSQFKPKYANSVIKQFFDNNCYAKFENDTSKFKIVIEKI